MTEDTAAAVRGLLDDPTAGAIVQRLEDDPNVLVGFFSAPEGTHPGGAHTDVTARPLAWFAGGCGEMPYGVDIAFNVADARKGLERHGLDTNTTLVLFHELVHAYFEVYADIGAGPESNMLATLFENALRGEGPYRAGQ